MGAGRWPEGGYQPGIFHPPKFLEKKKEGNIKILKTKN
jgi:hypothetical protein